VNLKGEGFLPRVKTGQHVRAGDPLIDFAPDYVATQAKSLVTPIIVTTMERVEKITPSRGEVQAGRDVVLELTLREAEETVTPAVATGAPSLERELVVRNPTGLHARPAAMLASTARSFKSDVRLRRGDDVANAKSVTAIMGLEIVLNDRIALSASGPDAKTAIDTLVPLIEAGLGEEAATPERGVPAETGAARPAAGPPVPAIPTPVPSAPAVVPGLPSDPNLLRGIGVSPGVAIGQISQWRQEIVQTTEQAGDPPEERAKFERALSEAKRELDNLREQVPKGDASAGIFSAHLELLEDPDLVDVARDAIERGTSAAAAWRQASTQLAGKMAAARTELFAGRAADVRDVGRRVLRHLAPVSGTSRDYPENAILVAEELSPSDTVSLDRARVRGFCTVIGGRTSHVAILARSLQIPAITAIDRAALTIADGMGAILDGSEGTLKLSPSASEVSRARDVQAGLAMRQRAELELAAGRAVTTDGRRVEVAANLGADPDAAEAIRFGAEGVGLLRSEFLFMERPSPPTEDEQFEVYARVAKGLGPERPLVIRTLDVGGDKPLPYLPIPREDNPFLGVRGIRLSATRPDLLRAQLRAAIRASAHGRVHVMFPMIATVEDWRFARGLLEEERAVLGMPPVPAGIMVEVPSAALLAETFAREAEFFSIGTNDLTQYTLAIDRGHASLGPMADSIHPAVLRLIDATVKAAQAHGRWVGVCGDLAADPAAVPILVGLGVQELSVSAPAIPAVKAVVRQYSSEDCRALAVLALAASTAADVRALAAAFHNR
jgi:phosphocarrier protein FPr